MSESFLTILKCQVKTLIYRAVTYDIYCWTHSGARQHVFTVSLPCNHYFFSLSSSACVCLCVSLSFISLPCLFWHLHHFQYMVIRVRVQSSARERSLVGCVVSVVNFQHLSICLNHADAGRVGVGVYACPCLLCCIVLHYVCSFYSGLVLGLV